MTELTKDEIDEIDHEKIGEIEVIDDDKETKKIIEQAPNLNNAKVTRLNTVMGVWNDL